MELNPYLTIAKSLLSHPKLNDTNEICMDVPLYINSKGLWVEYEYPQWWIRSSLPLLEFQLVLFCITLTIVHQFLKRFGVSKISSQILIGLIFGCSWNQLDKAKFKYFKASSQDVLVLVADLGYTLYLFLSGVKTDVTMTIRTGKSALIIGIQALLIPLMISTFVQSFFEETLTKKQLILLPVLVSFHIISPFAVVSSLINELKIVNSELGRLGLSSALVSDILGLLIMLAISLARRYNDDPSKAAFELGSLILMFLVVLFVFRPVMLWIIRNTPQGMPVKSCYIQGVILMAVFSTVLSNFTGQSALLGPYVLGLAVPDGAPLGSTLVDNIECVVTELLMPILVTTCALRADVSKLSVSSFDVPFTKVNVILICVAFVVKVGSCFCSSLYCKLPFKDSLALSLIMSSKGYFELVLYTMARDNRSIDNELFLFCIIFISIIATLAPAGVRCLYDPSRKYAGYQNRNIMHLNPASDELRVLACLHRNENINPIIHLLNLSCPTVENPLAIHVFHLIERSGGTTPVLISHRLQSNPFDKKSYSRHIIHYFDQFERNNNTTVYVECFTSISPCRLMHDDVCMLALDKITSLIILPFHRTWTVDGYIDSDDYMIRTLNYSVLERAPCSIGIFVDRGNLGRMTSSSEMRRPYLVCVIFVGGKDDREALSYVKRMVRDPRVNLTVLRLLALSPDENNGSKSRNWEDLVDEEVLKDFKGCVGDGRVMFIEEVCKDGQQTAFILRQIANKFDLIIVGRRHGLESPQTAGLNEWNDFPELGVLGDLIATTDINKRSSSLLVLQQQLII